MILVARPRGFEPLTAGLENVLTDNITTCNTNELTSTPMPHGVKPNVKNISINPSTNSKYDKDIITEPYSKNNGSNSNETQQRSNINNATYQDSIDSAKTVPHCNNHPSENNTANPIVEAILAIDRLPLSDEVKANLITQISTELDSG